MGIGTLLAGIIGISNIMLIVVKERTQEIGVKRALGASPFNIISNIVTESLVLTSISGIAGLMTGAFIMEGVSALIGESDEAALVNPTVDFNVAVVSLAIIIASGILAGLFPSQRAMSIKPVDALRDE